MQRLASIYIDIPALRPGTIGAYALAFLCTAVALALRVAIDPYVVGVQFITFAPAIIITALISGFGAGFFCTVLCAAAVTFFVLPPRLSFYIDTPGEGLALVPFFLISLVVVICITGLRFAIQQHKRSEAQISILAREAEHRAKNVLSNVKAMVHLSKSDTPEGLKRAIEGRIEALAKVHSLFVQSRWTGAELGRLVEQELSPYSRDGEMRTQIDGPTIVLKPDVAQAMAMALHELATNAAKYGALSTTKGQVHIEWSLVEDGQLTLRWTEAGGPPISPPTRKGFGSNLIETMIRGHAGGDVRLDWHAEGLVCEVTLPAT